MTCSEAARIYAVKQDMSQVADGVVAGKNAAVATAYIAVLHAHQRLANVHGTLARLQRHYNATMPQINKAEVQRKQAHAVRPVRRITQKSSPVTHSLIPAKNCVEQQTAATANGNENGGSASEQK